MSADWQRSQAALLALGERMGQLHERNPGARLADAVLEVRRAMTGMRPSTTEYYSQDSLIELAAAALYAWVVADEEGEVNDDHRVSYWTCRSCLQPVAMRSGADVVTTYHHGLDSARRESPLCHLYHPSCAPQEAP